ncbi:MAG: hypothetical protein RSE91_03480 [Bacilli bacterium]
MKIKKSAKIIFSIITIILIIVIAFLIIGNKKKSTQEIKVINEIKEYGYTLKDNQSDKYKELFKELEKTLKINPIDEENYAKLVSQMFVIDFYTLTNKIAKTDVGGTEFIYNLKKEDFIEKAMDTIYKYLESNIYDDRKQELPKVIETSVENIKTETFKYGKEIDNKAYVVSVNIKYEKNLGYDTKGKVTLIHQDKKLVIAKWE